MVTLALYCAMIDPLSFEFIAVSFGANLESSGDHLQTVSPYPISLKGTKFPMSGLFTTRKYRSAEMYSPFGN